MDFTISSALKLASLLEGYIINPIPFIEYVDKIYSNFENLEFNNIANYNNNILSKKIEKIEYKEFLYTNKYKSNSKIVISGLGADEFFGGYARYKTSSQNGKLIEEMSKDIDRIWIRNFGRDDRVCSDNGIEMRYPFFDDELLEFLSKIPDMKIITNFELKRGHGEKIMLRNICYDLGFKISSGFEKRAIQFGTRLAKETNIKIFGSNRKANGKAQIK